MKNGNEKTIKFLENLKNDDYEVVYYIPREMDISLIYSKNDIKHYSITELIRKAKHNSLPIAFLAMFQHI